MNKELERIKKAFHTALICAGVEQEDIETEKALTSIEKSLKALKVIKEKGNFMFIDYNKDQDKYYIYDNVFYMRKEITKEEYELLREVLYEL